jgi:deazaflavin-dependent oxidoreductase (nitroreductase family)
VPADLTLKTMNGVHRFLLGLSRGRIGWRLCGMPVLELTTRGRTSGKPRTVLLTSPVQEGDAIVIVASRGGDDRHPDWYRNLCADPAVEVAFAGAPKRPMRARVASPGEREAWWPRVTATYDGYARYQTRTAREIPLVVVEPARGE